MSRKVVCLLVLIFVLLVSFCLVSFGHGPSSIVYGPKTTFRAYRSSLLLRCAVAATVVILLIANGLALSCPAYSDLDAESPLGSANPSSMIFTLRC